MDGRLREEAREKLRALPQALQEYLLEFPLRSSPMEELFNGVVAGDCPVCGSFNTRQGDDTPLKDPTVAICLDCFSIVCLECGEIFAKGQIICTHHQVCAACKPGGRSACRIPVWECTVIERWKAKRKRAELCDRIILRGLEIVLHS